MTRKTIPDAALDKHIAILGKTGSGKTNTAKVTVERLLDRKERVCIIDPTSAWWGLRVMADGRTPGYGVVVFGGRHGDLPLSGMHGTTIADVIGKSSTPAILDTRLLTVSDRTRFFTDFAEGLIRSNQGPLTLVIDEAHLFMPQSGARAGGAAPAMLHAGNNLVSLGRGLGLRIILISQRPAKLHKDSLTQVETLVAMRLIAPQDRNAIKDWIIEWADPDEGNDLISGLPSMPTGEAVLWSPELGILEKVQFPLAATFDSSKAPTKAKADQLVLAPIDIEALEGKLKEAAEEAKANDPRHLKAEIARLRKDMQAAAADAARVGQVPDPQVLEKARQEGYERGAADTAQRLANVIGAQAENLTTATSKAINHLDDARALLIDYVDIATTIREEAASVTKQSNRPAPGMSQSGELINSRKPDVVKSVARATVTPPAPAEFSIELDRPQMKVLEAIARWSAIGFDNPTRIQVAFLAGYSPKGGGFNNILGKLRSSGLVDYPSNGIVALTDAGRQAVCNISVLTADELVASVRSVLNTPQQTVLEAILQRWPAEVSRDEIAEASGYSSSGGGFNNILGRLRSFGLIDYPRTGFARAEDWLFP